MDLKSTYNKIAKDWFNDHKEDYQWVEGGDKFISLLNHHGLILDIGCGAGVKAKYLSEKGFDVIGIDFSEKMIEIAKEVAPNVKFFVMDAKDLSGLKEHFDGIFAQAILLHFPGKEIKYILRSWIDKLKVGGYLYLGTKEKKSGQTEEMVIEENDYGYSYKRFFSFFTSEEIKSYLTELNMEICWEKRIPSGSNWGQWIQIISKKKYEI